jgi:hypothetical protein
MELNIKRIKYIKRWIPAAVIAAAISIFSCYKIINTNYNKKSDMRQKNITQNAETSMNNSSKEATAIVNASALAQNKVATLASDFVLKPNKFGNTPLNISNGGYMALQESWLYYNPANSNINNSKVNGIYKSMLDGSTGLQKLTDDNAAYLNVVGSWIYYKIADVPGIWKIKINGEDKTKISNHNGVLLNVIDDWIYFLDTANSVLCKIKTDGSSKEEIANASNYTLSPDRKWIYFTGTTEGLYKLKVDSKEILKISSERLNNIKADGDYIYGIASGSISGGYSTTALFSIKSDGSSKNMYGYNEKTLLTVNGGYIYYIMNSNSGSSNFRNRMALYRSKPSSALYAPERLGIDSFSDISFISIFDDTLYFITSGDAIGKSTFCLYKIKTNGNDAFTSTPQLGIALP